MRMAWTVRSGLAFSLLGLGVLQSGCANGGTTGCDPACPAFSECCASSSGPVCRDVVNDPANCGGCGRACLPGQTCRTGMCTGTPTGDGGTMSTGDGGPPMMGMCMPSCASSERCCRTTCIPRNGVAVGTDGRSSPTFQNCNGCGIACDPQRASACSMPAGDMRGPRCMCGVYDQCSPGQVCVLDGGEFACVNLSTDPNNCGEVGHACAEGESCVAGNCVCGAGPTSCAAGQACCGGTCVNTTDDERNCGGCGVTCPGETTCSGGMCLCGSGSTARACRAPSGMDTGEICCGGACVPQDSNNCGGCGVTCNVGDGEMCVMGGGFGGGAAMPCCGQAPPFPGFPAFCFGGGGFDAGFGFDGGFPFP